MTDNKRTYSQRGDDYLIEAQRLCAEDRPKAPVVCPYCGTPMVGEERIEGAYWYECYKCGATAPTAETEQAAYEAAMQRWLEPNRVLTLEEVREHCKQGADAAPLWVEFSGYLSTSRWIVVDQPDEVFCADTVKNFCMSYVDIYYEKSWRCWLRKPTQKEREATLWREK